MGTRRKGKSGPSSDLHTVIGIHYGSILSVTLNCWHTFDSGWKHVRYKICCSDLVLKYCVQKAYTKTLGAYMSSCLCSEPFKVSKPHLVTGHFERLGHEFDMKMNVVILQKYEFQGSAVSNDIHVSE
jgi:hypothetical protein